ncbi:hypothetical protein Back2_08980 [Nocardioides baekrokdamisoli]|uniref:PIN domain-containing protein n=1 Tax=Nocardioides baekrokdamisoli TaxID=1804624 RepID=A0A3G9ISJ7_9ACTN|nr:PIN domain-containing protein [Nocardioides baekrokdamisoli]BBH16611.1 hypothetical protein Back2_08980 [Nocardioides baekrokdamisoli]
MGSPTHSEGLTLDAGALIGIDRGSESVRVIVERCFARGGEVHVLPEVIAQAWRGGARSARLGQFLAAPGVVTPLYGQPSARRVGGLSGACGHTDVIDVHVALHARERGHRVVTSDPDDIRAVDPTLPIITI